MKKKPDCSPNAADDLRRRAEERLKKRQGNQRAEGGEQTSGVDTQRILHELQVHQIELEMQNEELRNARNEMEAGLEKYSDLYDFAPVGYFSLDEDGRILEINLTGAALLGTDRSRLINQRLPRFVAPDGRTVFLSFLNQVFAGPEKQVCEAPLLKADGTVFPASFHGTAAISLSAPQRWCRVVVSDITALKEAEETRRRIDVLAVANRQLHEDTILLQAEAEALKQSEQHQIQLLEQSQHMQKQLRQLSHRILHVQEEERKRISRELHDKISQMLVGINIHLETLAREAVINPKELKKKITRTQRQVEKSVDIVHQFARELRPAMLDDLGLIPALNSFLKSFMKQTGLQVSLTAFAEVEKLSSAKRAVLYRVAQEALTNVASHAEATKADVSIQRLPKALLMQIKDDGKSFDVKRALQSKKNRRLGLVGMRERVEMINGQFAIESAPGKGTTIQAQIPFPGRTKEYNRS
jgi:PAS domain S-box-containing protein